MLSVSCFSHSLTVFWKSPHSSTGTSSLSFLKTAYSLVNHVKYEKCWSFMSSDIFTDCSAFICIDWSLIRYHSSLSLNPFHSFWVVQVCWWIFLAFLYFCLKMTLHIWKILLLVMECQAGRLALQHLDPVVPLAPGRHGLWREGSRPCRVFSFWGEHFRHFCFYLIANCLIVAMSCHIVANHMCPVVSFVFMLHGLCGVEFWVTVFIKFGKFWPLFLQIIFLFPPISPTSVT